MEANFCVDILEEALRVYGIPAIFNSDQGSQFTSDKFIDVLKSRYIQIVWMGKGGPWTTYLLKDSGGH